MTNAQTFQTAFNHGIEGAVIQIAKKFNTTVEMVEAEANKGNQKVIKMITELALNAAAKYCQQ